MDASTKNNGIIYKVGCAYRTELSRILETSGQSIDDQTIFITDNSFLYGNYFNLLSRECYDSWIIPGTQITRASGFKYLRLLPLMKRAYRKDEIDKIKFSLHVFLSLGHTVVVHVVSNERILEENFGCDCNLLIGRRLLVSLTGLWDEHSDIPDLHKRADSSVEYVYESSRRYRAQANKDEWMRENSIFIMRYSRDNFSSRNDCDAIKQFREFLQFIQDGRCAISQEYLRDNFHIDHIWPLNPEDGVVRQLSCGNNTLINLQALTREANLRKSNKIEDQDNDDKIFSRRKLAELGICERFANLTYRTINRNPINETVILYDP
ncbi:MAG: HNH endonuclease [Magnetococcales bacterium]|nr:HNH endonuclease [Magnetococcales bacterium]